MGQWTKKLLATIAPWVQREFGETNFHITQCLSGHGCFMSYVTRIGKRSSPICMYCPENDDVEYTVFKFDRFREEREELKTILQAVQESLREKGRGFSEVKVPHSPAQLIIFPRGAF